MKFKVAISDYVFPDTKIEKKILRQIGAEIVAKQCKSVKELISITKDADGLLNCYFKPVGEKVFKESPKLKVVVRYGIGVDTIDVKAATKYGIMVANVPDYCIDEVSNHTIALLLSLVRKIIISNKKVKNGNYSLSYLKPMLKIEGKIAGFIGFGRIGRAVAKKLSNFKLKFVFYDPYINEEKVGKAKKVELEQLLKVSDFILIHAPENNTTRHLLNRKKLSFVRPNAIIINTARGGIIDTEALVECLKNKKIAGAGLDVIENVPPISKDHSLCKMENVVLTPHSAWYSEDSIRELRKRAAEEVKRVLLGKIPKSLLNQEILSKRRT